MSRTMRQAAGENGVSSRSSTTTDGGRYGRGRDWHDEQRATEVVEQLADAVALRGVVEAGRGVVAVWVGRGWGNAEAGE